MPPYRTNHCSLGAFPTCVCFVRRDIVSLRGEIEEKGAWMLKMYLKTQQRDLLGDEKGQRATLSTYRSIEVQNLNKITRANETNLRANERKLL